MNLRDRHGNTGAAGKKRAVSPYRLEQTCYYLIIIISYVTSSRGVARWLCYLPNIEVRDKGADTASGEDVPRQGCL